MIGAIGPKVALESILEALLVLGDIPSPLN